MQAEIVPSLLDFESANIKSLGGALRQCATSVQLDICDGLFVPEKTCTLAEFTKKDFLGFSLEVHGMVRDCETFADQCLALGAQRIVLHCEAKPRAQLIDRITSLGCIPVIAKDLNSPLELLNPYLHLTHHVQFMAIVAGAQGRSFSEKALADIEKFHVAYPAYEIAVDGGVKLLHIQKLIAIGVSRIIVGSVLGKDPSRVCTRFSELQLRAKQQSPKGTKVW